jgi:CHASE1-domain containing sensor protein
MIIGVGLLMIAGFLGSQQHMMASAELKFRDLTNAYMDQLSQSLDGYGGLLYATQGLFAATSVDADIWQRFIDKQHIFERYPGMEAVGYSHVTGDKVILTYLLEADGRHEHTSAQGFNLAGEPVRAQALERARSSKGIAATAMVRLAGNDRSGFLLLLPVYNRQATEDTPSGYSSAAFDISAMINKTIGKDLAAHHTTLTIKDITTTNRSLLYGNPAAHTGKVLRQETSLKVGDRSWLVVFETPLSSLVSSLERIRPLIVLSLGIVLTLSASAWFYVLALRKRLKLTLSGQ